MEVMGALFTIGHSTHQLEIFLGLLRRHEMSVVADVRSAPYSRYCPQYNKERLASSLKDNGLKYVFLGRELGARAEDPSCYANGRVQYSRLAERREFLEGIERLKKGMFNQRIALMCAESNPLECHRTLLVAQALDKEGLDVQHIYSDGHLERHRSAMDRLLDVVGLPHEDLFHTKEELLAEALARQEEKFAHREESQTTNETGEAI